MIRAANSSDPGSAPGQWMAAMNQDDERPLLSIVTPAYREAENLRAFYVRLVAALHGVPWEWIVIDDHSPDATFTVLAELAAADARVRGLRLSRNHGSHAAILCGLQQARGQCAAVLASDLQDPPEVIPQLLEQWRAGAQVVWAVREGRPGETRATVASSRLYYRLMRCLAGMEQLPAQGADFLLLDRVVIEALRSFRETNVSLFALVTWMGFRQRAVPYIKEARARGISGWTMEKKLKLFVDSITSFTYWPVRVMSYTGFSCALLGFAYALFLIAHAFYGHPVQGWSSLMVVMLVVGGIQMIMMGVLGEYLWRALSEARGRPQFLVEAVTPPARSNASANSSVGAKAMASK